MSSRAGLASPSRCNLSRAPRNDAERKLISELRALCVKFVQHLEAKYPDNQKTKNLVKYFKDKGSQVLISTKCTGGTFSPTTGCMLVNLYSIAQKALDDKLSAGAKEARKASNALKKPGEPHDCAPTKGLPLDSKWRLMTRILHELAHSTGYRHDIRFYNTHRFFLKVATEELGWRLDVNCRVCCESSVPCQEVCPKCTWEEDPKTCKQTMEQCRPDRNDPGVDYGKYAKPFVSVSAAPAASTPRMSRSTPAPVPRTTPAPVPPPKCSGLLRAIAPRNKPALPVGHAKTGVTDLFKSKVQTWLLQKIQLNRNVYKYTKTQDAFYHPAATPGTVQKFRKPVTPRDFMMLGYFQYQSRALMCAVRAEMPGSPVAKRLSRNFAKALVGIEISGNQGVMRSFTDGTSLMSVDIDASVAKTHNIIAHEMAHCALWLPREAGIDTAHNKTHSDLWKRFLRIAIKRLGWEFVEFTYPNVCLGYGICDLRDLDQTKVYNNSGKQAFGTKFRPGGWAK